MSLPRSNLYLDAGAPVHVPGGRLEFQDFDGAELALFWFRLKKITVDNSEREFVTLAVVAIVPDRDTGDFLEVTFRQRWLAREWENRARRASLVRESVRRALIHELDEHIYVDGKRVQDPHSRERELMLQGPPFRVT